MSDRYSETDIRHIAEKLAEELRECEDGMVASTAMPTGKSGFHNMETEDLSDLHKALLRTAKANKITLDMSEHDDRSEGLPFSLTFIVRNTKAQIKCPHCGNTDTAGYLYGLPAFDEEMKKKPDEGKPVLGGCSISVMDGNGRQERIMPARYCNKCRKDFGTPPVLIN